MPVIHVRVARRPDLKDAPRPPLGAPPGASGAPSLIEGSDGAAIVAELAPRPEDVVVTKHTTSPFHTTDLGVYLRRFGVSTLLLTGYSTTGVVEGSLRDARDQDYDCVVVRDCCAAATVQEHDTCMDIVFPRMAWVASVDEVINAIRA
jgi:nicotinamidase-related amidase